MATTEQTKATYDHETDKLYTVNTTAVESPDLDEPTPTEQPQQRMVHFNSDTPQFIDPSSKSSSALYSNHKIDPISISAPVSNPTNNPSIQITPNEHDTRLRDLLHSHNAITAHSQTIRSLQYLHSLRVKDNLFQTHNIKTPQTQTNLPQMTPSNANQFNDATLRAHYFDDFEEMESDIEDSISDWTLTFMCPTREKQFRIFVTERYGTSIRVSILAMIVAYIFLALINDSFVKDSVRLAFVCLGLSVMLIMFVCASSFSKASSSSTLSYLKSLFRIDQSNAESEESEESEKNSTVHSIAHTVFSLYSSFMTAACVTVLLLLLILQNTLGGGTLPDDRFLVYYLLSLLVTATYGSLGYTVYLSCAWFLWFVWNILAISVSKTEVIPGQSFDYASVNVTLILAQLVLGHQVKAKEKARRKGFLRAMNYVHSMQQQSTAGSHSINNNYVTPREYATPQTGLMRHPTTDNNNSTGFDIVSVPSYRDKLMSVLETAVDKSFGNTDSPISMQMTALSNLSHSIYHSSPRKRGGRHHQMNGDLYQTMRRELTKRSGTERGGMATGFGTKLRGLVKKRESNALGIFNMVRGLGGNLCHDFEMDNDRDKPELGHSIMSNREYSTQMKLKDRTGVSGVATDEKYEMNEINGNNDAGTLLTTVKSGVKLESLQESLSDALRNKEPHCGSVHELPLWYGATMESYILTGYRLNYSAKLCLKSMFQKHNETANIWTELIPALTLVTLVILFNLDDSGHFWVNSKVYGSDTKAILYISMPFIIVRPIVSALAHTFACMSQKSSKLWWQLDILSIVISCAFGTVIWIHCLFYCDQNLQSLYMFAIVALSLSTTFTALTTKNILIRDLSLGAFFLFTLIFLWLYELYYMILTNEPKNAPWKMLIWWSSSMFCTVSAVVFRATNYPEAFMVKRKFKKLMQETYEEKFCIETGDVTVEHKATEAGTDINPQRISTTRSNFKQQVSFGKMLHDIQSFATQTEEKLAKIENMDSHLYDDIGDEKLKEKKEILEREIEELENEIVAEIKNEITVEQCLEDAYVNLISEDDKQWFNYLFTSHNFWHIFMNGAVITTVVAWKIYFDWRAQERNWC